MNVDRLLSLTTFHVTRNTSHVPHSRDPILACRYLDHAILCPGRGSLIAVNCNRIRARAQYLRRREKQKPQTLKKGKLKMKLKASIAIVVLAGLAVVASAQSGPVKGRSFTYSSSDAISQDFSTAGTVTLKSASNVTVDPYLYITGNLSANWVVDGWGVGQDTELNSIYFYHNETLSLQLAGFANPAKTSGTQTGAQAVQLSGELAFYNNAVATPLYDSGMVAIANLNGMFQPSGPNFGAAQTGGVLRIDFSRQIAITPEVGPGTYQNVGLITVSRN